MTDILLWDLDGTLLNFKAAERSSMLHCFAQFQLGTCTEQMIRDYSALNDSYWKRLERGEITKEQLVIDRFVEFFSSIGVDTSIAPDFNRQYQYSLGDTVFYQDHSYELLEQLHSRYRQYIVTNGPADTQYHKLQTARFLPFLDGVFISGEIGAEKPSPQFFDAVFASLGTENKSHMLIIGDSLTSDMAGGIRAGIRTCWYNPDHQPLPDTMPIDYTIQDLNQITTCLAV